MRKKSILIRLLFLVIVPIAAIWYMYTVDMMNLDPADVKEITLTAGTGEQSVSITEDEAIADIIGAWNEVTLQRGRPAIGGTGSYAFRVAVVMEDGKKAPSWSDFAVYDVGTMQKGAFFYSVVEGKLNYGTLDRLFE